MTGPRQVGKTTLLEHVADNNRKYVSLDDPVARRLAVEEPLLFLQRYSPPVIIDVIQYAPDLLPYIKLHVDKNKNMGDFWLIGSQMFQMMKGVSESLAGRVGILPMQGLSLSELNELINEPYTTDVKRLLNRLDIAKKMELADVYSLIFKGSMPALHISNQSVERFYASYVDTYIHRDIRDLKQVADEMQFQRFLTACAARTSQMVNYSELAKEVGISSPTAKSWLSLLVKSYLNAGKRPPIFYYRDSDQKEIDLIIEENGKLQPIEIKKSANPKKNAGRHFKILAKTNKEFMNGSIICMSDDLVATALLLFSGNSQMTYVEKAQYSARKV